MDGIYALASLGEAPIRPDDAVRLGLEAGGPPQWFAGAAVSDGEDRRAADTISEGDHRLLFVGTLDDKAELAERLGLANAGPAAIALAAFRLWDSDVCNRLAGDWSMLCWNARSRRLGVGVSRHIRDLVLVARKGDRIAIAPDIAALADLPWIDDRIDPLGLAFAVAQGRLEQHRAGRSILADIQEIEPGTWLTIESQRTQSHLARPLQPARWQGRIEDAVESLEAVLRANVRRAIAPYRKVGILVSGGLDSTLLAWLASEELRPDQSLVGFCSVAPPGSHGLIEEWDWARMVGDSLGFPVLPVYPRAEAQVYRPAVREFRLGLRASPRHYLYHALYEALREQGAGVVLDGAFGESSVTRNTKLLQGREIIKHPFRLARGAVRLRLAERRDWTSEAFVCSLAPEQLEALPAWIRNFRPRQILPERHLADLPIGLPRGWHRLGIFPTALPGGGLRSVYPFRDAKLLSLGAGIPARFIMDRMLARNMLKGRVPDALWSRPKGTAFSPDYERRIQAEAPEARARFAEYRACGAAEYLDLGWLDHQLSRSDLDTLAAYPMIRIQNTVIAAEFVTWWNSRAR